MKLTADEYYRAAQDHAEDAQLLYDESRYVIAHYVAGLAVECMLRAYAVRNGAMFDGRHDLKKWFELARFDEVIAKPRLETVAFAYHTVFVQWNSTQRYYSDVLLRALFRNTRLDRGIQGDAVKELARRIVEAAFIVVNEGTAQWKNWKKK